MLNYENEAMNLCKSKSVCMHFHNGMLNVGHKTVFPIPFLYCCFIYTFFTTRFLKSFLYHLKMRKYTAKNQEKNTQTKKETNQKIICHLRIKYPNEHRDYIFT